MALSIKIVNQLWSTKHRYLTANGISWIACGKNGIVFPKAMEILADKFGAKRLEVVGGGHINGAFLQAGLLDEVSLMIGGPLIKGRSLLS